MTTMGLRDTPRALEHSVAGQTPALGTEKGRNLIPERSSRDPVGVSLASALRLGIAASMAGPANEARQAKLAAYQPEGPAQVLASRVGPREVSIRQYRNGVTEVALNRPPITQLVLSGGGAKGVAYPGAIRSLEERGLLDDIRTLSGSSAGGITAALLASGMDASAFKALSDEMDLISLLDSDKSARRFVQQLGSKLGQVLGKELNAIGLGTAGDIAQLMCNILPRIQSDAVPLENVIRSEARASVLDRLAVRADLARFPEVVAIREKLLAGGVVTFGDLETLSRHIPEIKSLNVTGTAMFQGRPQLAVFNASLTPDMDIATAAHISGSFPLVFRQVEHTLPFMQPEQGRGESTRFQDGGVMLNVPVPELIDTSFEPSPIRQSDNLILVFEGGTEGPASRASSKSAAVDWVIGAPQLMRGALQATGLKNHAEQTVVVPLKMGDKDFSGTLSGTLNFSMDDTIKAGLQDQLSAAVDSHLSQREQSRDGYRFTSLDAALFALDDAMLKDLAASRPDVAQPVIQFRQDVRNELAQVKAALDRADAAGAPKGMTSEVGRSLIRLDKRVESTPQREWVSGELNRGGNTDYARLLNLARIWPANGGVTLRAAMLERERLDVQVIADTVKKDLIYPSIYRRGQSDDNIALLRRAEHQLARATTRAQVNTVLTDIADHYIGRQSGADSVPDLARSYLLREA